MASKPQYVQIEPNEDAASVRDRLGYLRGQRVLLIWPEAGTALTRKLDLVLVQREAMRLAIRLSLVTHEDIVIQNARELNISTFETIGASERAKWKRGRAKVFTTRFQRPKDEPDADELSDVASRLRDDATTPTQRRVQLLTRVFIAGVALAVLGVASYTLLPSAEVTLVPAQQVIEVNADVRALPNSDLVRIDVETGVIPALVVRAQIEERASIATTGIRELGSSRATGAVVFINKTDNAVVIPADSFVSTSAGTPILFRTMIDAVVPAGRGLQIEAPIEAVAEAAGGIGNVETGLINTVIGPLAETIEVRNVSPTFGGERRESGAVSESDRARLLSILRQQLQTRALDEMEPRLEENQFIISETIRIVEEREDWMIFSQPVGASADELSLTMRAVVQATAVDEDLARQVAFARLGGQIPRTFELRPDSVIYERGTVTTIDPDGAVTFTMVAGGIVNPQINLDTLQQNIAGRSLDEATRYLANTIDLAVGTTPQITLSPSWLPHLPLLPFRIRLQVIKL